MAPDRLRAVLGMLGLAAAASCHAARSSQRTVFHGYSVAELVPVRGHVQYRLRSRMLGPNDEDLIEERRFSLTRSSASSPAEYPCSGAAFAQTSDVEMNGRLAYSFTDYFCEGRQGLLRVGSSRAEPTAFARPEVWLLATTSAGDSWTSPSGTGPGRRTCSADSTPFCPAGVTVACVFGDQEEKIWVRDHYCRGVGWVGRDAASFLHGTTDLRAWTDGVVIDGQPAPSVPRAARELPASWQQAQVWIARRSSRAR